MDRGSNVLVVILGEKGEEEEDEERGRGGMI